MRSSPSNIERLLRLILILFITFDIVLILPVYASELRLDLIHPSLPKVSLDSLRVADFLARPAQEFQPGSVDLDTYLEQTQTAEPTLTPLPSYAPVMYTVQPGDILGRIARSYGTTVDAIAAANGIANPNMIFVGQELVIPVTPSPTNVPAEPTAQLTGTPNPPSQTPTSTPPPPSPEPTNTPIVPTATFTSTSVPPASTNTNTPAPPSATPTITSAPSTPTPGYTPVTTSPTHTSTPLPPGPTLTGTPNPPSQTPTSTPPPPSPEPTNTPIVPTATFTSTSVPPASTNTNTPAPSATPTITSASSTPTPGYTPVTTSPTHTSTPLPPGPTLTDTPVVPTATPTYTPVLPTATHTRTPLRPSPTLTDTPVVPTATLTYTPVPPSPTHTSSPLPPRPTHTPTPIPSYTPTSTAVPTEQSPTMTPSKAAVITATAICTVLPTTGCESTPDPTPTSVPTEIPVSGAFAVPTFHSIGIYWSASGGSPDRQVLVEFRPVGSSTWFDGLPMKYSPISNTELDKATYRGSIVHLKPNTTYEIVLSLEDTTSRARVLAKTWSEDLPIGETVTYSGLITEELVITESGSPGAYRLYDGRGATIDVNNLYDHTISINASHIIIRGFTLRGPRKHIIQIFEGEDIIIENNDMSNWGEPDPNDGRFGVNMQSAVYSNNSSLRRVIVQRNKIHHPRTDANSWAEDHIGIGFHPAGPQAIAMFNSAGNHVIRYNEIWSDPDHYFNDVIGAGSNGSFVGFPGSDSDIYGNYIANCWDDGIEAEGGGQNVRIWSNYVEECFLAIGNAANSIGPLYVWRNVFGRSYSPPGSKYGEFGASIKMTYADSEDWMTGHMYIFHNTLYNPNDEGMAGFGTDGGIIKHAVTRNNIIHVRTTSGNSIANPRGSEDIDFDFDLFNRIVPDGHEAYGIPGAPSYVTGAGFDLSSMTGNFQLDTDSLGYDSGEMIPNFNDWNYTGAGPDMGAHESGWDPFLYGVNASQTPQGR